jgi:hypothetical protein
MLDEKLRYSSVVTVIAEETTKLNQQGLFWHLLLPDCSLLRRFARKPLTEAAQALIKLDVNPAAFLRLMCWASYSSYLSSSVALSGVIWQILDDDSLLEKWRGKNGEALLQYRASLRDKYRPKRTTWTDVSLPAPTEDLDEIRMKAKREYADV